MTMATALPFVARPGVDMRLVRVLIPIFNNLITVSAFCNQFDSHGFLVILYDSVILIISAIIVIVWVTIITYYILESAVSNDVGPRLCRLLRGLMLISGSYAYGIAYFQWFCYCICILQPVWTVMAFNFIIRFCYKDNIRHQYYCLN